MKIAMLLPLLPLHVAAELAASTTVVKPYIVCTHTNCAEWDCKTWCNCYEETFDTTYEKEGCTGEDTCNCGEMDNGPKEADKLTGAKVDDDLVDEAAPEPAAPACVRDDAKFSDEAGWIAMSCEDVGGRSCPDKRANLPPDLWKTFQTSCCRCGADELAAEEAARAAEKEALKAAAEETTKKLAAVLADPSSCVRDTKFYDLTAKEPRPLGGWVGSGGAMSCEKFDDLVGGTCPPARIIYDFPAGYWETYQTSCCECIGEKLAADQKAFESAAQKAINDQKAAEAEKKAADELKAQQAIDEQLAADLALAAECKDNLGYDQFKNLGPWEDSSSYTCKDYVDYKWCSGGKVINSMYANYGAEENCCECGKK